MRLYPAGLNIAIGCTGVFSPDTGVTLVGNFVADVDNTDHGGIRWFESMSSGTTIA